MCVTDMSPKSEPEKRLAEMVHQELGVTVDPTALRLFLRAYWPRIAMLAHAVHDEPDRGRQPRSGPSTLGEFARGLA